jgi:hypothetical protein
VEARGLRWADRLLGMTAGVLQAGAALGAALLLARSLGLSWGGLDESFLAALLRDGVQILSAKVL